MRKFLMLIAVFALILAFGCLIPGPVTPVNNTPMPGSDRDAHGCIPSAGYTWCDATQKCIRPWEENCTGMLVGNDSDEHGCKGSAGYTWCHALSKCIRPWEENCTMLLVSELDNGCNTTAGYMYCDAKQKCLRLSEENCTTEIIPGGDTDEHGCIGSAGYTWCAAKSKCLRIWEETCTGAMPGSDKDIYGCIPSAGYTWCEAKLKCIRPWVESCSMSYDDAVKIAQRSACVQHGMIGNYSRYDMNQHFWWIELKNVDQPGCGAACIVYGVNRSAEINWMCTGLILPIEDKARTFCNTTNVAKVYVCGNNIRTVSSLMGGGSTFYDENGTKIVQCPLVAPDSMSSQCRLLLLGNNCVEKEIC